MATPLDPISSAIQETSVTTLRSVMIRLCNSNPSFRKAAEPFLLISVGEPTGSSGIGKGKRNADNLTGTGWLVARYDTCENCGVEFDVSKNSGVRCVWHEGDKMQDVEWDGWGDHDENIGGRIEDLVDEPDFAEGFRWTCCGELGDDKGCARGIHRGKRHETYEKLSSELERDGNKHIAKQRRLDLGEGSGFVGQEAMPRNGHKFLKTSQETPGSSSKAPIVVQLSDSSDEEEDHEEENAEKDPNNYHECRICGKVYFDNGDGGDADCLFHDEDLTIRDNCPLSMEEKEMLDPEVNPEWFYWPCCGEAKESEGCREGYHAPDRGMGY